MSKKKIDIELELANIPHIRDIMHSLEEVSTNYSRNGEIIREELLHRATSPKLFGKPGNAGINIFLKEYWPLIQRNYKHLNKIVELYSGLSKLEES